MNDFYMFNNIYKLSRDFIKNCAICTQNKKKTQNSKYYSRKTEGDISDGYY